MSEQSSDIITITITNWEKYNPRKDIENGTWIRLNVDLFNGPGLFELSFQEKAAWIFILTQSAKNKGSVELKLDWAVHIGIPRDLLLSTIQKLEILNCITSTYADVRARTQTSATDVRNVRNERTERDVYKIKKVKEPSGSSTPLREAFLKAFQKEFNRPYAGWGAKENAMASRLLKSLSVEKAVELATLYPQWNDAWVTQRGHPFEIFFKQYERLDAWAHSHTRLIEKIAKGKAIESNELKRAIEKEDLNVGIKQRIEDAKSFDDCDSSQGLLSGPTTPGVCEGHSDPFSDEIFDQRNQDDHAESY